MFANIADDTLTHTFCAVIALVAHVHLQTQVHTSRQYAEATFRSALQGSIPEFENFGDMKFSGKATLLNYGFWVSRT